MKLNLLDYKELRSYPSGSGIEFHDDKIYIVGDDATSVLVTNTRWKKLEEINLFESAEKRISKKLKADLEATAILHLDGRVYLLVMGSGSKDNRAKAILIDTETNKKTEFDCTNFYQRIRTAGIADLNIEGATQVSDCLVFCNRANKTHPDNHFIVTSLDFFRDQQNAPIDIQKVDLSEYEDTMGLSGACYSYKHDWLLFTTSIEDTADSYHDGVIGKSYLGVIEDAYRKIITHRLRVNELIDLPATNKKFNGYKIESVCIQSERKHAMKLHLVADNDTGVSYLFKIRIKF
ncbi:hypothetical protein FRZ67_22175 [Panacibacter ginsenosidivorans]|uniref:Uncharacterized protein n=1 Tax=Panacibacter ginsenosidivorans TaxID=1813871 RepID=A0A5B8VFP3_9BACT|nr:hypothetical protein [Panacibacter ginsenosidivorans]QEC69871.1 hypothetical protein FRZ67_22175 [Panacibacter ginsenosidivorans]